MPSFISIQYSTENIVSYGLQVMRERLSSKNTEIYLKYHTDYSWNWKNTQIINPLDTVSIFCSRKMNLAAGRPVPLSWCKFSPFFDNVHLLRGGGHLKYTEMTYYE